MEWDGWEMVSACGEVRGYGGKVTLRAYLEHQAHSDDDVEKEVAME